MLKWMGKKIITNLRSKVLLHDLMIILNFFCFCFICYLNLFSYVAAKSNYFGVGGGTKDFLEYLNKDNILELQGSFTVKEGEHPCCDSFH